MSGAVGGECDVWRGIAESGYMPGSAVYALGVALAGPPFGATGQHFDVSLAMARASVAHASAVLVRKRIAADTNLAGLGKDYGRNYFRARVAAPRERPNPTATN